MKLSFCLVFWGILACCNVISNGFVLKEAKPTFRASSAARFQMSADTERSLGASQSRRQFSKTLPFVAAGLFLGGSSGNAISIEEARERGEKKLDEIEKAKGEKKVTSTGIKYREERVGTGAELKEGDVAYIIYEASAMNGDYLFSLGRGQELKKDVGESYRMVLGKKQVPRAVEMGMEGMREGGMRKILVPPNLGWESLQSLPQPDTFSAKRKLTRIVETQSPLLFEVELVRVRPTK